MEPDSISNLRRWFAGDKRSDFTFEEFWQLFLLRIADRLTDVVDEVGNRIDGELDLGVYYYDLRKIAEDDDIMISPSQLKDVAIYLSQNKLGIRKRGSAVKVSITNKGWDRAQEINDAIFNSESSEQDPWLLGFEEELPDWLLVQAQRARKICGSSNCRIGQQNVGCNQKSLLANLNVLGFYKSRRP